MRASRERRLLDFAAAVMRPGEVVQLTASAKLGSVGETATKTAVASAAAAVVAAAMTGGVGFVGFAQREVYLVLTDRQVHFFEAIVQTGGPGKHLASFERDAVAVATVKVSRKGYCSARCNWPSAAAAACS